jgi:hypothetical protein
MSQARARLHPPPAATPFTEAMTGLAGDKLFHVTPGAESLTSPCDYDDPDLTVRYRSFQGGQDFLSHGASQSIHRIRPIQGDRANSIFFAE